MFINLTSGPYFDPRWLNLSFNSLDPVAGWKYFFVVGVSLESFFGTAGNLLVLIAILHFSNLRTPSNFFIANLSLADLMVTAIAQPSNVVGAISGARPYIENPKLCSAIATLCATGCIASTWNICMIAVNRYVVICHYHLYDKIYTKCNTILICIGVWVIIYLIQLPNHLGWGRTHFSQLVYLCTFDTHNYLYTLFYFGVGVVIPVFISFVAYLKIFMRVRNSKFVRSRAVAPSEKKQLRNQNTSMMANVKIARVLFKMFVVFLLMWIPAAIVFLSGMGRNIHPWVWIAVNLLAHGNSTLNVVVYATALPQFREIFRTLTSSMSKTSGATTEFASRPMTSLKPDNPDSMSMQVEVREDKSGLDNPAMIRNCAIQTI